MSQVKILVADDHEIVRRGLRALVEAQPEWELVAEAVTGREAVDKARQTAPDIAILDVGMPDLNGLEATRQILKAAPQTEILILTMHESEQIVREVLDAGARGYVLKSDAGRDLVSAVEALCQHRTFFSSKVSEMLLNSYLRHPDRSEPAALVQPPQPLNRPRAGDRAIAGGRQEQ